MGFLIIYLIGSLISFPFIFKWVANLNDSGARVDGFAILISILLSILWSLIILFLLFSKFNDVITITGKPCTKTLKGKMMKWLNS